MIMPNKYMREKEALIGVGSILLNHLSVERNLSDLWEIVKDTPSVGNFERFVLGLDLLFVLGLVEIKSEKLVKVAL